MLEISRESIDSFDVDEILGALMECHKKPRDAFNKVNFVITGYDEDPRELFEIAEVRRYMKFLDKSFPYLFFYFKLDMPDQYSQVKLLLSCICSCELIGTKENDNKSIQIDIDELNESMKVHFHYMNEVMDNNKYTEDDIRSRTQKIFGNFII